MGVIKRESRQYYPHEEKGGSGFSSLDGERRWFLDEPTGFCNRSDTGHGAQPVLFLLRVRW